MKKISSFLFMLLAAMTMNAKTLYCQMPYDWWWNGDEQGNTAAISLYAYGDNGSENAAWPGQLMTEMDAVNHIWSIDIDLTGYTNIIFARSSQNNDNWGAKTVDLPVSGIGDNNLYVISSSEPVWGDPGCAGSWSVYGSTPVEKTTYHIYVTNNTGWDVFYLYEWGTPNEITGGWPGAQGSSFEFSVAAGVAPEMHLIFHNNVGEGQPGDARQLFDITEARDYNLVVTAEGVTEGGSVDPVVNTYHINVTNNTGWDAFYMYEWGTPNEISGGWPGAQGSSFEFSVAAGVAPEMHLIFHNNVGEGQPGDARQLFDITEARDYYLTVTAEGVSEGQGEGQGIDRIVNGDSSNRKMMKDGQLIIIRDGKTFNALGTEVR